MEILNGRVLVLVDNSPMGILLPAAFNDFLQVSEDEYNHFELASFLRIIRYIAAAFASAFQEPSGSDEFPYPGTSHQPDPLLCGGQCSALPGILEVFFDGGGI
ncbi:MAG: spore germination protein [Blautia marasmi]